MLVLKINKVTDRVNESALTIPLETLHRIVL